MLSPIERGLTGGEYECTRSPIDRGTSSLSTTISAMPSHLRQGRVYPIHSRVMDACSLIKSPTLSIVSTTTSMTALTGFKLVRSPIKVRPIATSRLMVFRAESALFVIPLSTFLGISAAKHNHLVHLILRFPLINYFLCSKRCCSIFRIGSRRMTVLRSISGRGRVPPSACTDPLISAFMSWAIFRILSEVPRRLKSDTNNSLKRINY